MNTAIIATSSADVSVTSQTLGECLKSSLQFTGTVFYNICNGTQNFVPNGFWDYLGYVCVGTLVLLVLAFLLSLLWSLLEVIFG